jgi:hypothetical protein
MGVPNADIKTTVTSTSMPLEPQNGELEGARNRADHMLHARLSSSREQSAMFLPYRSLTIGLTCSKLGRMKEERSCESQRNFRSTAGRTPSNLGESGCSVRLASETAFNRKEVQLLSYRGHCHGFSRCSRLHMEVKVDQGVPCPYI